VSPAAPPGTVDFGRRSRPTPSGGADADRHPCSEDRWGGDTGVPAGAGRRGQPAAGRPMPQRAARSGMAPRPTWPHRAVANPVVMEQTVLRGLIVRRGRSHAATANDPRSPLATANCSVTSPRGGPSASSPWQWASRSTPSAAASAGSCASSTPPLAMTTSPLEMTTSSHRQAVAARS
jgi:hypothetical protein